MSAPLKTTVEFAKRLLVGAACGVVLVFFILVWGTSDLDTWKIGAIVGIAIEFLFQPLTRTLEAKSELESVANSPPAKPAEGESEESPVNRQWDKRIQNVAAGAILGGLTGSLSYFQSHLIYTIVAGAALGALAGLLLPIKKAS